MPSRAQSRDERATFVEVFMRRSLIVLALHRSGTASPLKAVLFASWLVMGGHLLSPENIATLYVLAAAWRPQSK